MSWELSWHALLIFVLASHRLASVPFSACLASPHSLLSTRSEIRVWVARNGGRESQLGIRLDTTNIGSFKGSPVPGTVSVAPGSDAVTQWAGTEAWHVAAPAILARGHCEQGSTPLPQ